MALNGFEQVAGLFGLPWVFVSGFFGLAQHEEAVFFAFDHSEEFAVVADALWEWFVAVTHSLTSTVKLKKNLSTL